MARLRNLIVAATTAASLTLTPTTSFADNNGENIAKILAGLAVLGIVAKAVDDRKDRRRATTQRNTIIQDRIGNRYGTGVINGDVRRLDRLNGVDVNPSYKRVRLPAQCQRVLETRGRQYLVYGQRCLSQNYQHTARLPATCERRVRGAHNRIRTFYGARCLANDGWRVARR